MKRCNFGDYESGHSPYFPASAMESKDVERAFTRSLQISLLVYTLISYGLSFFLVTNSKLLVSVSEKISRFLTWVEVESLTVRFNELTAYDGVSGVTFFVSMLVGIFIGFCMTVSFLLSYRNHVLVPKCAVRIDSRAFIGCTGGVLFSVFVIWTLYFESVDLVGNPYPGFGRIFVWPVFPLVGCGGVFAIATSGFNIIAGMWKAILQFGEKEGG